MIDIFSLCMVNIVYKLNLSLALKTCNVQVYFKNIIMSCECFYSHISRRLSMLQ